MTFMFAGKMQADISFFELAALDVSAKMNKKQQRLTLTLNNFIVLPDDVPKDVMQAITHWSQWIDYWAVDFNYHDDTFHNERKGDLYRCREGD